MNTTEKKTTTVVDACTGKAIERTSVENRLFRLCAFQAAAAALYGQAVKGKGKLIETSLLESAMVFQEAAIMESHLQGGETEPIGMPV